MGNAGHHCLHCDPTTTEKIPPKGLYIVNLTTLDDKEDYSFVVWTHNNGNDFPLAFDKGNEVAS